MELLRYVSSAGSEVFSEWFQDLGDAKTKAKIAARLNRITAGNFGDCKSVGGGVWEIRIDWGPGYRVYYAMAGRTIVLLLCGGDKRRQNSDIQRAIEYWTDYQQRTAT